MSVAIEHCKELLDSGPPRRLQRSLGLIKPDDPRIARRAELAVLVGRAPLVVLAVVEGLVQRNHAAESFFSDFSVHARSLVAAPLLILAEADCTPRLGMVAHQFVDAGLIRERDRARFEATAAPVSWSVTAYGNGIRPGTLPSPRWQLRLQLALLYPENSERKEIDWQSGVREDWCRSITQLPTDF
jgi:hypothetical protein